MAKGSSEFNAPESDLIFFKEKGFTLVECMGGRHLITKEGAITIVETHLGYYIRPYRLYTKSPSCAVKLTALPDIEVWEGN